MKMQSPDSQHVEPLKTLSISPGLSNFWDTLRSARMEIIHAPAAMVSPRLLLIGEDHRSAEALDLITQLGASIKAIAIEGMCGKGAEVFSNRQAADLSVTKFFGEENGRYNFFGRKERLMTLLKKHEDIVFGLEADQATCVKAALFPMLADTIIKSADLLWAGQPLSCDTVEIIHRLCKELGVGDLKDDAFGAFRAKRPHYFDWKPTDFRREQLNQIKKSYIDTWEAWGMNQRNEGFRANLTAQCESLVGDELCVAKVGCGHLFSGRRKSSTNISVTSVQEKLAPHILERAVVALTPTGFEETKKFLQY